MSPNTFLGLPIEGDIITPDHHDVPQLTQEEFGELVQAMLDDPAVVEFGWTQYTPYYSDGDTCYFSAREIWVRTTLDTDMDDPDDTEELEMWSHRTLCDNRWDRDQGKLVPVLCPLPETRDRARALNSAVKNGLADRVLLELFGDHARIKVTRDGIIVDEYEHD